MHIHTQIQRYAIEYKVEDTTQKGWKRVLLQALDFVSWVWFVEHEKFEANFTNRNPSSPLAGDNPVCLSAYANSVRHKQRPSPRGPNVWLSDHACMNWKNKYRVKFCSDKVNQSETRVSLWFGFLHLPQWDQSETRCTTTGTRVIWLMKTCWLNVQRSWSDRSVRWYHKICIARKLEGHA